MPRRRVFTLCSALSLLLCVAMCVLWVRSRFVGDYVVVCDGNFDGFHISIARGDVRFARGSWRGPQGERIFSYPIERVGEYSALKSFYIPIWPIFVSTAAMALVFWRRSQRHQAIGLCPR